MRLWHFGPRWNRSGATWHSTAATAALTRLVSLLDIGGVQANSVALP